jgi:extracellular factor (EF) 3-hydroxypalmitic acid methyl ester biosynthesis protein
MLQGTSNNEFISNAPIPLLEKNIDVSLGNERRSNPYILTRRRKNFDRRNSLRVASAAMSFLDDNGNSVSGTIIDISDSGACIKVNSTETGLNSNIRIGIPLIQDNQITGEVRWYKPDENNGTELYGIEFRYLENEEKSVLRKAILLNEDLLINYANEMAEKTDNSDLQQQIKMFFLIDTRLLMEKLINIDQMIKDGKDDAEIKNLFSKAQKKSIGRAYELETALGDNISLIKQVKQRVRALLGHFIYQSIMYRRAIEKPRGYPGDYGMIEFAYNNKERSEGIGKYFDWYGLSLPYTVSIRLRKDLMRDMLYKYLNNSKEENLNILNLASGGCREIREMFNSPINHKGKTTIMCVDQDEEAIEFADQKLSEIDTGNINVNLIQGNILRMENLDLGKNNSLDMIYSIGIADYLQDKMLDKMFKDCYQLLKTDGQLIIAYKDKERNKPLTFNWYGDWNFIHRNEPEFLALINKSMGKENISIDVVREHTGVIFFAIITKLK